MNDIYKTAACQLRQTAVFNSRVRVRYKGKIYTLMFIISQDMEYVKQRLSQRHIFYKKIHIRSAFLREPPENAPKKQCLYDRFAHACNKMLDIAHYVGFIGRITVLSQYVYRVG